MISRERIRRLEEVGHATWPALEEERRGGWLLRASRGATRRANSASPVGPGRLPIDQQIAACEAWYSVRELPPIFRLTAADRAFDQRLDRAGYGRDPGAVIMTRPTAGLEWPQAAQARLTGAPSESWLALMGQEPGRDGIHRPVLEEMFSRIRAPARFAAVEHGAATAAIGLGVVADEHLALYMMQTVPERRREGLATAVAIALATWGTGEGARHLFLQVHPENATALAFYTGLGFEPQYEYWYRQ